jgi:hypothetical protein
VTKAWAQRNPNTLKANDMIQFGFLPRKNASFSVSSMSYPGNLAVAPG